MSQNPSGTTADNNVKPLKVSEEFAPPARPARMKSRHYGAMVSFLLLVLLPVAALVGYLYLVAEDQYASHVGFSVRSEEPTSPTEFLGGLVGVSSATSSETDVLFKFIHSQNIVEEINADINLVVLYTKPSFDPVFAYDADGTIEDLLEYWKRMVKIDYDSRSGMIELRVHGFTSDDAQLIARKIFEASSAKINSLSAIARDDITRYSRLELAQSVELLKSTRQSVARFRNETQIVDPSADVAGQMGLLASLQEQLSEALISADLLKETTNASDPRVREQNRRIAAIETRIDQERQKLGLVDADGDTEAMSAILQRYEELSIDLEFAQQSYLSARAAHDAAIAQSQRQTRYLAAYIEPTRAQRAEYPNRPLITLIAAIFLTAGWFVLLLMYYSLRDRR